MTLAERILECGLEKTDTNAQTIRHLRVLNLMLLVAMGLSAPLGFFWATISTSGFAQLYAATFIAWAGILAMMHRTHDPVLGGRLACVVLYFLTVGSAILLGGAQSYALAWLMVLPVAAAVCVGNADLWIWCGIASATIFGFTMLPTDAGYTASARALNDQSSVLSLIAGVGVVSVLTSVWHAFQSGPRESSRRIPAKSPRRGRC